MSFDITETEDGFDINMDDETEQGVNKYLVYFCYEWMEMDSCIQFYIEVDEEYEYTEKDLVTMIINDNDGVAQMGDGSIVNLMQFVQSYVYLQEPDFDYEKQDEEKKPVKLVIH